MPETQHKVSESETSYHTQDLVAFSVVADRGSISAAARELGETKGAVSRRITRLERQLGAALLTRTGRSVVANEAGRAFRIGVGQALAALESARASVHGLDAEPRGTLRITAPPGVGTWVLAPILGELLDRHPHLTVDVRLTDAVLSFADAGIDVALRLSSGLPDSSLVARRLFTLDGCLVASPAYLERHGTPATPDELPAHRLLLPPLTGPEVRVRVAPRARPGAWRELRLRGRVLCHDLTFAQLGALEGAGNAITLRHAARTELAAGRLVEVLPDHVVESPASLWFVHLPGPLPPKVRALRNLLESRGAGSCGAPLSPPG
jgi:DNA-binding transcriptional LysR family regulator